MLAMGTWLRSHVADRLRVFTSCRTRRFAVVLRTPARSNRGGDGRVSIARSRRVRPALGEDPRGRDRPDQGDRDNVRCLAGILSERARCWEHRELEFGWEARDWLLD